MTLSKEQISELKKQLYEQLKHLPEEKRKEGEIQIQNLSDEAIEEMIQNQKESQVPIFREIVSGKIPAKKVNECKEAIAVLDIKPISIGHTVIIPKEKIENINKIPDKLSKFTQDTAKILSSKLKVKNIKIVPELKFNEVIINLIPFYDKELFLESERSNPSEEELNKTLETIKKENQEKEIEESLEPKKKIELKKFPRRIP